MNTSATKAEGTVDPSRRHWVLYFYLRRRHETEGRGSEVGVIITPDF